MSLIKSATEYSKAYTSLLGNHTPRAKSCALLARITLLFFFIFAAVFASGHMVSSAGWMALGLGLVYMGFKLLGGCFKKRRLDLIFAAIVASLFFIFASLCCSQVLSSICLGNAFVGGMFVLAAASIGVMIYSQHHNASALFSIRQRFNTGKGAELDIF